MIESGGAQELFGRHPARTPLALPLQAHALEELDVARSEERGVELELGLDGQELPEGLLRVVHAADHEVVEGQEFEDGDLLLGDVLRAHERSLQGIGGRLVVHVVVLVDPGLDERVVR